MIHYRCREGSASSQTDYQSQHALLGHRLSPVAESTDSHWHRISHFIEKTTAVTLHLIIVTFPGFPGSSKEPLAACCWQGLAGRLPQPGTSQALAGPGSECSPGPSTSAPPTLVTKFEFDRWLVTALGPARDAAGRSTDICIGIFC